MKLRLAKYLAVAACVLGAAVLPTAALAYESVLGQIVSSGSTTNNSTTATPFSVGKGQHLAVQCTAPVYVVVGTGSSTAATAATGVEIDANALYDIQQAGAVDTVAILPVSGSSTCTVFRVILP